MAKIQTNEMRLLLEVSVLLAVCNEIRQIVLEIEQDRDAAKVVMGTNVELAAARKAEIERLTAHCAELNGMLRKQAVDDDKRTM